MLVTVENCNAGRQIEIEFNDDSASFLFASNLLTTLSATDCPLAEPQFGALLADDSLRVITNPGNKTTPIGAISCYAACNHQRASGARTFSGGIVGVVFAPKEKG